MPRSASGTMPVNARARSSTQGLTVAQSPGRTPISSQATRTGSGYARSGTTSMRPRSATGASSSSASVAIRGPSSATSRGVNAAAIKRRRFVWYGGSRLTMIRRKKDAIGPWPLAARLYASGNSSPTRGSRRRAATSAYRVTTHWAGPALMTGPASRNVAYVG
jgi:hypothetical protein